jgi:hypothetical protein
MSSTERASRHPTITPTTRDNKRALKRQNFMVAWTMAGELPKVQLSDALELLLLARDLEPARYDRAAPRWHARLCTEHQLGESGRYPSDGTVGWRC